LLDKKRRETRRCAKILSIFDGEPTRSCRFRFHSACLFFDLRLAGALHTFWQVTASIPLISAPPDRNIAPPNRQPAEKKGGDFAEYLADVETDDNGDDEQNGVDEQNKRMPEAKAPLAAPTAPAVAGILPAGVRTPNGPISPLAAAVALTQGAIPTGKIGKPIDPAGVQGPVAFALRLTEKSPTNAAVAPGSSETAIPAAATFEQALDAAKNNGSKDGQAATPEKQTTAPTAGKATSDEETVEFPVSPAAETSGSASVGTTHSQGGGIASRETPRHTPEAAPLQNTRGAETAPEPPKAAAPRQIAVRVESAEGTQAGGRSVDLVVEQRGAALHLSVRSADPILTAQLRDSLPELTSRLESQGVQADLQRTASVHAVATDGGMFRQSNENFQSDSQRDWGQGGGSGQSQDERQRHSQQQKDDSQPDWLSELERNLFAPGRISTANER
jgi:hypothetical protein